ncbi:TGS domain-containing protein [candidate division KSB1 bacterium]|nr:TGS domain-containing protein [candidate division KSB1 bacterium]
MENTAFCKDVKKYLNYCIESKEIPLDLQNDLINLFIEKLGKELRKKNFSENDIEIIMMLFKDTKEAYDTIDYYSFDNKLVKTLKFISTLYTTCVCVSIFQDSAFLRNLINLAFMDYSNLERVRPISDFRNYFDKEKYKEYNDLTLALKEIHIIEYQGEKYKNGGFSEKHERIRSTLNRILIKNSKDREYWNEKYCETFTALCRKKDVLELALVERYVLLKFLDYYPKSYFTNRDKRNICEESLIVHSRIAERLGFYWAKWRLEDSAFKHLNPEEFNRIADQLKKTRKQREEFIETMKKELYAFFRSNNLNEATKGKKILNAIRVQLKHLNLNADDKTTISHLNCYIEYLLEDLEAFYNDWEKDKPTKDKGTLWRERTLKKVRSIKKFMDESTLPESFMEILDTIERSLRSLKLVEIRSITGRPKNIYSIYRKEKERNIKVDDHPDLIGMRLILNPSKFNELRIIKNNYHNSDSKFNIFDFMCCYNARDLLLTKYGPNLITKIIKKVSGSNIRPFPNLIKEKDFISKPKSNGYKALHLVFKTKNRSYPSIEIQIMDKTMEETAEFGIAAHWVYEKHKRSKKNGNSIWNYFYKKLLNMSVDRINVLTPELDVLHFPKETTALDFASNTDLKSGQRCTGAIVNNIEVKIDTKLNDGDMVKSMSVSPQEYWLKVVK